MGFESWLERDNLMLLDFDPAVVGIASEPFWLRWTGEAGERVSHAPDFFARRADGSAMVIDCRPVKRRKPRDVAKFDATGSACALVGWQYRLFGAPEAIETENVRWLAGYRHPRYRWGSVYAALAVGEVDAERTGQVLTAQLPEATAPVFAVDASTWARCDAECSSGRGFYYSPTRHSAGQPVVAGWWYSWIAQLGFQRDSWTAPVDARRLDPAEDAGRATAAQVRRVAERLGGTAGVPLFLFTAGYDPIALTVDLADLAVAICVRIRCDRVFYALPTPVPGRTDRPPRHGARFLCADPANWLAPEQTLQVDDEQYGRGLIPVLRPTADDVGYGS